MPDPSKVLLCAPLTEDGGININLRVAHGDSADQAAQETIDPDAHAGTSGCNGFRSGFPFCFSLVCFLF